MITLASTSPLGVTRRHFIKAASAATAGLVLGKPGTLGAARSANDKILVGIIGCNGRGMDHIAGHLSVPNVEIAYVCDVDNRAVAKGVAAVAKKQNRTPQGI